MTGLERALLRFLGLWAVVSGVELLERTAYRAGVTAANRPAAGWLIGVDVDEQGNALPVDEDLVAVDVSDVVDRHADCCGVPAC